METTLKLVVPGIKELGKDELKCTEGGGIVLVALVGSLICIGLQSFYEAGKAHGKADAKKQNS